MVISDEEARELIENLIIKYVPASMDKTNALAAILIDRLAKEGK